tara:strand:- start:6867 stop:7268 length:402 start_codon:yes stop_codon:yes gene_type:complete
MIDDFLKLGAEQKYELGDVILQRDEGVNWLLIGKGRDAENNATYKLLKLQFPEELLPKVSRGGIVIPGSGFIPDIDHHEYIEAYSIITDQPRASKKIGHIDLSGVDPDSLEGLPILHVFPDLRKFYEGSEYFQ